MALILPLCATASAAPAVVSPPSDNVTICVDVNCSEATTIAVRYQIPSGPETFCGEAGPFEHNCDAGTNHICHTLCITIPPSEIGTTFPVDILVKEKDAVFESRCTVNIKVR